MSDKLPDSLFEPPPEERASADVEVKLEEGWVREKAARQAAAAVERPAPRRPRAVIGVIAGVVLVAIVGTVVAIIGMQPAAPRSADTPAPSRPGLESTVLIEIRAKPPATVKLDGRPVGKTPLGLRVPRRQTRVTIEARIGKRTFEREIVPDHDQTIDFTTHRW